jgi:hypothetical protein
MDQLPQLSSSLQHEALQIAGGVTRIHDILQQALEASAPLRELLAIFGECPRLAADVLDYARGLRDAERARREAQQAQQAAGAEPGRARSRAGPLNEDFHEDDAAADAPASAFVIQRSPVAVQRGLAASEGPATLARAPADVPPAPPPPPFSEPAVPPASSPVAPGFSAATGTTSDSVAEQSEASSQAGSGQEDAEDRPISEYYYGKSEQQLRSREFPSG